MNLAIIGATGLVGKEMLKVLDQRKIQFTNLTLVSSKKSVGKSLNFQEKSYQLISIEDALEKELESLTKDLKEDQTCFDYDS